MTHARHHVLEWAEQGRIAPANLRRALELAGELTVLPGVGRKTANVVVDSAFGGSARRRPPTPRSVYGGAGRGVDTTLDVG